MNGKKILFYVVFTLVLCTLATAIDVHLYGYDGGSFVPILADRYGRLKLPKPECTESFFFLEIATDDDAPPSINTYLTWESLVGPIGSSTKFGKYNGENATVEYARIRSRTSPVCSVVQTYNIRENDATFANIKIAGTTVNTTSAMLPFNLTAGRMLQVFVATTRSCTTVPDDYVVDLIGRTRCYP